MRLNLLKNIRLTQEQTDELVQEVHLSLAKAGQKAARDFDAYTIKVVKNTIVSFLRRLKKEGLIAASTVSIDALEAQGIADDVLWINDPSLQALLTEHGVEAINKALNSLPPEQGMVMDHYVKGASMREIASFLDYPLSRVYGIVEASRKAIRAHLGID